MLRWFTAAQCVMIVLQPIASSVQSRDITRGPYLQNATASSVVVVWETSEAWVGTVHYSTDHTFSASATEPSAGTHHEIKITGLSSNTTYYYYVSSGGFNSTVSSFTTAPGMYQHFRFAVYGDTRTGHAHHMGVLSTMANHTPAFIINTGDLVAYGGAASYWDTFFSIISPHANHTPYYPVTGNHDLPPSSYLSSFSLPGNERYYSFNWSNAHFIVLDSNLNLSNGSAQNTWLRGDLERSKSSEWIFVAFHHPPYSSASHGSSVSLRNILNPIFTSYNVTAVFNGHDHDYEHAAPGNGIHYFVAGGGGAPLYANGTSWFTVYSESAYHFLIVDVMDNITRFTAIRENGTVMEQFTVVHPDTRPPEPVNLTATDTGLGGQVFLNWSTYDWSSQGVVSYRVYHSKTAFSDVSSMNPQYTLGADASTLPVGGLENNTAYHFAVVAVDQAGNFNPHVSTATAVPTDITPPSPPEDLVVQNLTAFSAALGWQAPPEPDVAGYRVYLNDSTGTLVPVDHTDTTAYTFENLTPDTTYTAAVCALDMAEPPNNSTYVEVNFTTLVYIYNHPPEVLEVPEVVLSEDTQYNLSLSFFRDPDGDSLTHTVAASAWLNAPLNGTTVHIKPLQDRYGGAWLNITASDGEYTVWANLSVSVLPVDDPPELAVPGEVTAYEDETVSFQVYAGDLRDAEPVEISSNIEEVMSGAVMNCTGTAENGTYCNVTLQPDETMIGSHTLIFTARDSNGSVESAVEVHVLNTNDPPSVRVLSPEENATFGYNSTVNLSAAADDPDLPYGDMLTVQWAVDGTSASESWNHSTVLQPGNHTACVLVSDLGGETDRACVSFRVLEKAPEPSAGEHTENEDSGTCEDGCGHTHGESGIPFYMILAAVAVVAAVAAGLVVFVYLWQRRF